jgi:uncharacterized protein YegL
MGGGHIDATQAVPQGVQCIGIVVDRSGSMAAMRDELTAGVNLFIAEQGKLGPAHVTVSQFDDEIELVVQADIAQVPVFGREHFVPRGSTALLDGIGSMIQTIEGRVPAGVLDATAAPVIVILTDGQENASSKFNRQSLFQLISAKRQLGWTFTFMGANQDAISVGGSIGLPQGTCVTYLGSPQGQEAAWSSCSAQVSRVRSGKADGVFSPAERMSCSPSMGPRSASAAGASTMSPIHKNKTAIRGMPRAPGSPIYTGTGLTPATSALGLGSAPVTSGA